MVDEKRWREWRTCEFCGCYTNAKARACCDRGRDADKPATPPEPAAPAECGHRYPDGSVCGARRGHETGLCGHLDPEPDAPAWKSPCQAPGCHGGDGHHVPDCPNAPEPAAPRVTPEDWQRLGEMQDTAREVGERLAEVRERFGLDAPEPAAPAEYGGPRCPKCGDEFALVSEVDGVLVTKHACSLPAPEPDEAERVAREWLRCGRQHACLGCLDCKPDLRREEAHAFLRLVLGRELEAHLVTAVAIRLLEVAAAAEARGRDAGLEEAARECEAEATWAGASTAEACARRIRALRSK